MKLKLFDTIEAVQTRRIIDPFIGVSHYEINTIPPKNPYIDDWWEWRHRLTFQVHQKGRAGDRPYLMRQAREMFSHEIYGPVIKELIELTYELYEIGLHRQEFEKIFTRIDNLIREMSGK